MKVVFVLMTIFVSQQTIGQSNDRTVDKQYLSSPGINRLANTRFGSLVSGQSGAPSVTNYASFSPVEGSFTFNGSIPLGKDTSTQGIFSFLSFKIKGDLASESYAVLFQNTKINTNTSVQAQWDFRLKRKFKFSYFISDQYKLKREKDKLQFKKKQAESTFNEERSKVLQDSVMLQTRTYISARKLQLKADTLNSVKAKVFFLRYKIDSIVDAIKMQNIYNRNRPLPGDKEKMDSLYNSQKAYDTLLFKQYDSLNKYQLAVTELQKEQQLLFWQQDSIKTRITDSVGLKYATWLDIDTDYKSKLRKLEDSAVTAGMSFSWFSIQAGTGKVNFYSYDPALSFAEQINKRQSATWLFGASWNYFSERVLPHRIMVLNIGFQRREENNIALLSTQDISQEYENVNAGGDTTRIIKKNYKAYTDQVVNTKLWNLSGNVYFMSGSRKTGLHIFPSVDIYDHSKTISNLGVGYLLSFKNKESDKPVINAEAYIHFQDLFNELEQKKIFINRNEIGVRFSFPFNFF